LQILLQSPSDKTEAWRAALAAALPEAAIAVWPDAPAGTAYALVWKPPAELFTRVRPAKAIFNLGAGVDALLAVPTLPPGVPVIRLEDAGMATQMVEYVALAVLRAYREADAYAAQQREGRWQPRRRIAKSGFGVGILGFGVLGQAVAAALAPFGFPLRAGASPQGFAGVGSFAGRGNCTRFWRRRGCSSACCRRRRIRWDFLAAPRSRPCRVALTSSMSPGATSWWTMTWSRRSTAASSKARRSTSFATSRCPWRIRSGIIRESR
jgi:hypothetical protein